MSHEGAKHGKQRGQQSVNGSTAAPAADGAGAAPLCWGVGCFNEGQNSLDPGRHKAPLQ